MIWPICLQACKSAHLVVCISLNNVLTIINYLIFPKDSRIVIKPSRSQQKEDENKEISSLDKNFFSDMKAMPYPWYTLPRPDPPSKEDKVSLEDRSALFGKRPIGEISDNSCLLENQESKCKMTGEELLLLPWYSSVDDDDDFGLSLPPLPPPDIDEFRQLSRADTSVEDVEMKEPSLCAKRGASEISEESARDSTTAKNYPIVLKETDNNHMSALQQGIFPPQNSNAKSCGKSKIPTPSSTKKTKSSSFFTLEPQRNATHSSKTMMHSRLLCFYMIVSYFIEISLN